MTWWNAHTHSHYSTLDGMSPVKTIVARAVENDYPALGLTDHGNMAGAVTFYKECRANDIVPFIGTEAYLLDPYDGVDNPKARRYHVGLLALNEDGYKALVRAVSLSHTRPRFSRFPRLLMDDLADLSAEAGDDIALLTGCYFGLVQQTAIEQDFGVAQRVVEQYATMFPHTFVEVQHHNIEHGENEIGDDQMVESLIEVANNLGLPVLATQDSHYVDEQEKPAHALMKRMTYGSVEDAFPGDSFHLADEEWVADHYYTDQWEQIDEAAEHLLSLNTLRIPALDKFQVRVPTFHERAMSVIRKACQNTLDEHGHGAKYQQRLDYELGIIEALAMGNYFYKWRRLIRHCRKKGWAIEARGSANASLVCYYLGITQVDPIKWNLNFERFLSKDRIKPPDIDLDIEDEHRQDVIEWLQDQVESVAIGNWSKLGAREDDDRGSVLITWIMSKRRECEREAVAAMQHWNEQCDLREAPKEKKTKAQALEEAKSNFRLLYGDVKTLRDVKKIAPDDYVGLKRLAKMDSVYKSHGVHASGVLMSGPDLSISDYIPTMLVASSNTTVTQFDQDAVEEWGLLKDDFLGQITLTVMRRCQELIGEVEDPTDFTWIPEDDAAACKLLREGRTDTGIFHFEGYTKAKGGRELGIKRTNDAVLAQALYMPGCMDIVPGESISQKDLYVMRRKDPKARKYVKYLHPIFENALKSTHGAVVFQDQVMQIMRDLGMTVADWNTMLKVMKDSGKGAVERNLDRMKSVRTQFDALCDAHDIDPDEAWNASAAFVAYGFNKPHATGYGIRSYRCAYLKAHYPLEFMTALLQSWAGKKKEPIYVREARRMGIRVLPPHVNVSGSTWTLDWKRKAIRRGLVSIKGVGLGAAVEIEENAPFESVTDLIARTNGRKVTGGKDYEKTGVLTGVLQALGEAGALDELED